LEPLVNEACNAAAGAGPVRRIFLRGTSAPLVATCVLRQMSVLHHGSICRSDLIKTRATARTILWTSRLHTGRLGQSREDGPRRLLLRRTSRGTAHKRVDGDRSLPTLPDTRGIAARWLGTCRRPLRRWASRSTCSDSVVA
jgi:hypothetical protein